MTYMYKTDCYLGTEDLKIHYVKIFAFILCVLQITGSDFMHIFLKFAQKANKQTNKMTNPYNRTTVKSYKMRSNLSMFPQTL